MALKSVDSGRQGPALLALGALGVVYGDLGTSPLYALQAVIHALGGKLSAGAALGALSLIFWTLVITISIKYCVLVMRADNHGEGGTLALMAVVGCNRFRKRRWLFTAAGLLGAALLYGDGAITPAISVLSALEGLDVATTSFSPFIVPGAVAILVALFFVQQFGTAKIGVAFGPVMLAWFATLAALGVSGILSHPGVLAAINPLYAIRFFMGEGWKGFLALGGVFLCITGGEALYADIGPFGRWPIRTVWYGIVLPALLLNYAGQVANIIARPGSYEHPFYQLAPQWSLYPLVFLATLATIIASQAIITGAFSLTRQAMHLGWLPGFAIRHTSSNRYGQIYVPLVNWLMMLATIFLAIVFRSSARLAGAYGSAVSATMLLTTILLLSAMHRIWKWPLAQTVLVGGVSLAVDVSFFSANLTKIVEGGWIPLLLGAIIFVIMTTWRSGIDAVHRRLIGETDKEFLSHLRNGHIPRVPGTAVFLTRYRRGVPALLVQHVRHMGSMHKTVIELTVKLLPRPRVADRDRSQARCLGCGFWRVNVRFGFNEVPDLLGALEKIDTFDPSVNFRKVIYFGARDLVVHDAHHPRLRRWRLKLFGFLLRNSVKTVDRFNLPPENFVEIARQVAI